LLQCCLANPFGARLFRHPQPSPFQVAPRRNKIARQSTFPAPSHNVVANQDVTAQPILPWGHATGTIMGRRK
jgi:hypothetical protein